VTLALSTSARAELTGGPFDYPITEDLRKSNSFTYVTADATLKLTLSSSGQISGSYKPSALYGTYPIQGTIVGKGDTGDAFGFILSPLPAKPAKPDGTGLSGSVRLIP
jgi:hypothetical protein